MIDVSRIAFYAIFLAGALMACAEKPKPAPAPTVVVTGCSALPRLQASRADTLATKQAISAYIDKWDALCAPATGTKP